MLDFYSDLHRCRDEDEGPTSAVKLTPNLRNLWIKTKEQPLEQIPNSALYFLLHLE